jgi:small conductance mechanosensitive channel
VRPWVNAPDYWAVKWELTRKIKEAFDQKGISIPFPQRDVHLFQENPPAA